MPTGFWIKRFLLVYSGTFAVLLAAGLLRSHSLGQSATESATWAGIGTAIFITTRIYRSRRGEHCELCGDTPDGRSGGACELKKYIS